MAQSPTFSFTANLPAHPAGSTSLFRPPTSPPNSHYETSTSDPHTSSGDYFSLRSRKRSRPQSQEQNILPSASSTSFGHSTTPNINVRYQLAGGYDTPGLMAAGVADAEEGEEGSRQVGGGGGGSTYEQDYRRRVRDESIEDAAHYQSQIMPLSGPLARERNGVARLQSSPNGSPSTNPGWTRFAFSLVGKVFNFGTSMIKGFYAGGGEGYEFKGEGAEGDGTASPATPSRWNPSRPRGYEDGSATPVPGSWRDDFGDEYAEHDDDEELDDYGFPINGPDSSTPIASSGYLNPSSPARRPPHKRRQTDRDSWVIVGSGASTPGSEGAQRRQNRPLNTRPRHSASRANSRRGLEGPLSRRSSGYGFGYSNSNANSNHSGYTFGTTTNTGSPLPHQRQQTSAAYMAPQHSNSNNALPSPLSRRASVAATRSPSSYSHSNHRTSLASPSLSSKKSGHFPHENLTRRHSGAPTAGARAAQGEPYRRPSTAHGPISPGTENGAGPRDPSYISPEATRFVRRQARADRAADKAMSSMSRKLEELIRQGQAALGTKVSVEGLGEGIEFEDGVSGNEENEVGGFGGVDGGGWKVDR